jgi:hypothetical protein
MIKMSTERQQGPEKKRALCDVKPKKTSTLELPKLAVPTIRPIPTFEDTDHPTPSKHDIQVYNVH